jgi:hypothetical protein
MVHKNKLNLSLLLFYLSTKAAFAFLRQSTIPKALICLRTKSNEAGDEFLLPNNNNGNETFVTKEMFFKDLLADPKVKRKQKGGYKVMDNRDLLPYQVQLSTPDPYTHPEVKKKNAKKVRKRPDGVEQRVASKLFQSSDDPLDDTATLLGEFTLDKHTTTGDILEISGREYKVVKHRCQYKYAGGKRFVMVRKILHVTEVSRLETEEFLQRQWTKSAVDENDFNFL